MGVKCRMRGIVVNDEVKAETLGGLLVNQLEKARKLPVPMAWHARPNDLAVRLHQRLERQSVKTDGSMAKPQPGLLGTILAPFSSLIRGSR